jgi:outer membrane receptor protein involved in Fe transport
MTLSCVIDYRECSYSATTTSVTTTSVTTAATAVVTATNAVTVAVHSACYRSHSVLRLLTQFTATTTQLLSAEQQQVLRDRIQRHKVTSAVHSVTHGRQK